MLRYLVPGLVFAAAPIASAWADCNVANNVRVCTGTYNVPYGIALDYPSIGGNGGNGSDGGAFVSAGSGGNGAGGGSLAETFSGNVGLVFNGTYAAQNVGLRVLSLGGSGGTGGYGYVGAGGARGGDGAAGGSVNLSVSNATVSYQGIGSVGIGAFSTGGSGGQGGNTTLSSGAGGGGNGANGGQVSLSVDANTTVTMTGSKDSVSV